MLAHPVHIGADLKAERERLGTSLAALARELHVQERYLAAIEAGETPGAPGGLPGVGYVLGYVRAYAVEVGLDGEVAVDRYKAEMAIPENLRLRDTPHIVTKRTRRKLPRGIIPAAFLLLGAVGFAGYYAAQAGAEPGTELPPEMMEAMNRLSPDTLSLTAETASYVRVTGRDGEVLLSAILVPGQVWTVPAASAPTIDVRDAGAVRLGLGERDFGPLGRRGQSLEGLDALEMTGAPSQSGMP